MKRVDLIFSKTESLYTCPCSVAEGLFVDERRECLRRQQVALTADICFLPASVASFVAIVKVHLPVRQNTATSSRHEFRFVFSLSRCGITTVSAPNGWRLTSTFICVTRKRRNNGKNRGSRTELRGVVVCLIPRLTQFAVHAL